MSQDEKLISRQEYLKSVGRLGMGLVGLSILAQSASAWDRYFVGATNTNFDSIVNHTKQYSAKKYTCTTTLDWNNGNVQYIVLANGSQTFTFANPIDGGRYILILKQPSSGAAGTVAFPAEVSWSGASAPTLTATNSKVDILAFVYDGSNTKYYGTNSLNY